MSDPRSSPVTIVTIGGLAKAVPLLPTDSFALCQNPAGCGETDPLFCASMQQVADYLLPLAAFAGGTVPNATTFQAGVARSTAPAPGDNSDQVPTTAWVNSAVAAGSGGGIKAVEVLGSLIGVDLNNPGNNIIQFPLKYPFGTPYAVTEIIWSNASQPITGVQYDLKSADGSFMTNGTVELPIAPVPDSVGGSIMRVTTGPYLTQAYISDQGQIWITGNYAPGTCDLHLIGFSLI